MSLFQICYGPEIGAIHRTIQKYPGITKEQLIINYQYRSGGDITSLVDATLNFLINLKFIKVDNSKAFWSREKDRVMTLNYIKQLKEIADEFKNSADPNYIFSTMHFQLFVVPNKLFIQDLYYETNLKFEKLSISQEKVNAWKRIMEYFGLGYRVYGGFYALPHSNLVMSILKDIGTWEGPLQLLFEKKISPIIPCVYNGTVFNGMLFAILNIGKMSGIELSKKQDLPYLSYGENKEWNWVKIGGEHLDTLYFN